MRTTLIVMVLAFLSSLQPAHAQTAAELKQKIAACHTTKLNAYRSTQSFSVPGELTCPPGNLVGFPPSCRTDDRSGPVNYAAPAGYKITNASVVETSRTSRTDISGFRYDTQTASVNLSCNGHGCGGEGRVWVHVALNGTIEHVPTEAESKKAMDDCLEQVLK